MFTKKRHQFNVNRSDDGFLLKFGPLLVYGFATLFVLYTIITPPNFKETNKMKQPSLTILYNIL